ncbi:serine hydrolase domain-containing protein [Eudoraea sp.]|uniref:serine hydrolase domain-containing protein n=1 Tax=Eudoraea sp. TaxID=1979955 RepID=UPI003C708E85
MDSKHKFKDFPRADAIFQSLIYEDKVPGLAICVSKYENICFNKGYGLGNIEQRIPIDPTKSIFRIASVSKPIAAMSLAYAVQEGLIDLDASFYDYVPYFPEKKHDFTIKQLAGHTAGIRGYKGKEYALNKPFGIKDSLALFQNDPLLFVPGTSYLYNSYDWVMISLAIQEVTGISFEDFVKQNVLDPLEMKQTFPEYVDAINKNEVTFYTKKKSGFTKATPVNNRFKLAGGGYLSTVTDLIKLGQETLNPSLVSKEILNVFVKSQTINKMPTYYGLGWQVSMDKNKRRYFGHQGNGVGGYSNFFVYPDENMVIAVLINCTDPKVQSNLDKAILEFF